MSEKAQKVCFLTQKLQVKTLECTEKSGKIWILQGTEQASCSVHPSFIIVNSAQKEANFWDIYGHKKSTRGRFYVIPFGILDVLDETFQSLYDSTDFKTFV